MGIDACAPSTKIHTPRCFRLHSNLRLMHTNRHPCDAIVYYAIAPMRSQQSASRPPPPPSPPPPRRRRQRKTTITTATQKPCGVSPNHPLHPKPTGSEPKAAHRISMMVFTIFMGPGWVRARALMCKPLCTRGVPERTRALNQKVCAHECRR